MWDVDEIGCCEARRAPLGHRESIFNRELSYYRESFRSPVDFEGT